MSVVDRTVPICENGPSREVGCVRMTSVERFWAGVSTGGVPAEQLLPARTRAELVSQFAARNVESRRLTAAHPNLTTLSSKQFEQERDRTMRGEQVSYMAFSLPAYADRYALVHAMYVCGNLCAYGWMFVLEQSESGWRVLREQVLWVS